MALVLKFRSVLPQVVVDELDWLLTELRAILFKEHNPDGTHGDITVDSLTIDGGTLSVPEQPQAQIIFGVNQTFTTATPAIVTWLVPTLVEPQSTNGFDVSKMLDATGQIITPPEPGTYLFLAQIRWAAGGPAVGTRKLKLVTGVSVITEDIKPGTAAALTQSISRVVVWPNAQSGLTAFYWVAEQDSGGNLNVVIDDLCSWTQIIKLS